MNRLLKPASVAVLAGTVWLLIYWYFLADALGLPTGELQPLREQFLSTSITNIFWWSLIANVLTTGVLVALVLFLIFEVSHLGTALAITGTGFLGSLHQILFMSAWIIPDNSVLPVLILYQLGHWLIVGVIAAYLGHKYWLQ